MADSQAALAYEEPSIAIILNLAGLLLALNLLNSFLDKFLYCGLIGQLFIGILWGTPGAQWLDRETETVIQQLGYLGLIMLVYEGGLSTSIKSLRANIHISLSVALTGISVPIGLSFVLRDLVSATPLQAFAAGAALSATSLGTTFTILSTTQLITTRLGTVTTAAAMLDDVVGLVMVQIISNLGGSGSSSSSFSVVTVIRPLFVSIGFALFVFLLCSFCLGPLLRKMFEARCRLPSFTRTEQFAFVVHTCVLVGIIAAATYAGTSSLFAAYLAGTIISWFDASIADSLKTRLASATSQEQASHQTESLENSNGQSPSLELPPNQRASVSQIPTGEIIYEKYFKEPVHRILIPLFFASIGFAIPITKMFKGSIVWRGIVYAILMAFGKMVTGIWLVRFSPVLISKPASILKKFAVFPRQTKLFRKEKEKRKAKGKQPQLELKCQPASNSTANNQGESSHTSTSPTKRDTNLVTSQHENNSSLPPKPKSLYPPAILGLAMIARGEVGYLIASLAESQGIFSAQESDSSTSSSSSEIYLVVVWAISVCTLIGPICVGTLVKRVKKVQKARVNSGTPDPLGVWGLDT
ncbi:uncharacterized protein TRUGW13939_02347 [Talaromyces rugulosus]|uniref:Cation/H+ exchanger transmembrane domain-containing protein n=1 Tax=Talaromyces rugulosus TaxID=121627 RepID=A0A7H8QP69_TALRU|nr:uncharacterized protein TRUGW13939_02347 [Talaromyces rugulosus]QKX55255.1 hypothetical protein TRUGW13939_02347 [Talaromyces rugulosus]